MLPSAGLARVEAVERRRNDHGMAVEQVIEECCISMFCVGVKVTNMNRGGGSHPGVKIHNGDLLSVAQSFLKMGPPATADLNWGLECGACATNMSKDKPMAVTRCPHQN